MYRTSNIANLQFKWLQELLDIDFPEAGIMEVGITGPSTYFIYQKLHRLLSSIVPLTCSPIRGCNLVRKCSRFGGINPLVSNYQLSTRMCAHFVLAPPWFSRCQKHSPRSGKTTNIWISPISISDIPRSCIDAQCIFHSRSSCCGWYNSSSCYHQWCKWCGWWMAMWSMVQTTVKGHRRGVSCIECDGLAVLTLILFSWCYLFNDRSLCYITQNAFSRYDTMKTTMAIGRRREHDKD